jgi:putative FmdB family regulatory protein
MPTYRYRCGKCGDEFEVWQPIKDEPLRSHDHGCGGELLKVLTPAGIVLKGSGFYKTDSRSGRRPAATPSGEKAEGASGDGAKRDGDGAKRDGESGSSKSDPAAKPEGDGGKSASQSEASSTTS